MGFRTTTVDLERLWAKIPDGVRVTVMLEPTRNAWVPLAAWLQARARRMRLLAAAGTTWQVDGRSTWSEHDPATGTLNTRTNARQRKDSATAQLRRRSHADEVQMSRLRRG